jgi:hypothetical protein
MAKTPTAGTPLTGSGILPTVQSYGAYIYWALGFLASLGIGYVLYKMNFQIAAVLVFLGAILALFYYYVKWFQLPSQTGTWPPYVTPCPDFLTVSDSGTTSGFAKCIDTVGVSANGQLQVADPTNTKHLSDPKYYFSIDRSKTTTDLCQSAAQYGLTWSTLCPE